MNTSYTDEFGNVYNRNNLMFVLLNATQLNTYFANYSTMTKEQALEKLLFEDYPSLTYSSGTSYTVSSNTYIIAFYMSGGSVVKVTSNYAYINNSNNSCTIVYIRDLMFTDDLSPDNVTNVTDTTYDLTIELDTMFTTKYDYLTGIEYNINDYNLYFVVFNGSQFKKVTDYVANGLMSISTAIANALTNSDDYTMRIIAGLSAQSVMFEGLLVDTDYYIVAYYMDSTNRNINVVSTNVLANSYISTTGVFNFRITTLSNNFSFTIASIISQEGDGVGIVSFDIEQMNSTYYNYSNNVEYDDERIIFVEMTEEELQVLKDYYNNGAYIEYILNSHTYNNLTLEEALELTLYYYRLRDGGGNTTFEFYLASGDYTIQQAINMAPALNVDQILGQLELPEPETASVETHYVIAIYLNSDGRTFDKVSSNIVRIDYTKYESGQTEFTQSLLSISSLFNS